MTGRGARGRPTVAVAGGKGGCGKTTTALGLALVLVRRGRRPVVVDADVDVPDVHIRAGVGREPGLDSLAAGEMPVRVLQSSPDLPGVDVLAAGAPETAVDEAIERLSDLARPVLLDCPAGAGPDAAAPLRAADVSVLVTTTAPQSRQDAAKTARMADALNAPPVATVRLERGEHPRAPAGGHEPGARPPLQGPSIGSVRDVEVPTVSGRPLRSDRVLDRYETVAADLPW